LPTVLGDTTVVRSGGSGAWGPIRDAVEEKRAIPDGTTGPFVEVYTAIALPNGGALAYDPKSAAGPALELFDSTGRFVAVVGRQGGGGPGEFRAQPAMSLAVGADGTIFLLDVANNRIDRFAPDGKAMKPIPVSSVTGNGTPEMLRAGANGSAYVRSYVVRERGLSESEMIGYFHYDSTGRVLDTIPPQRTWFLPGPRGRYAPADQWSALGDGRVVLSRTDLAGFLVKPARGDRGMVMAQLAVEPVQIDSAERHEIQEMVDFWDGQMLKDDRAPMQHEPVPDHKPAIRQLLPDLDGRIWLQRNVASVRVPPHPAPGAPHLRQSFDQPTVWSAFRADGTYLGDVRFPVGMGVIGFSHDVAWAVGRDKDDRQFLARYRIPGIAGK